MGSGSCGSSNPDNSAASPSSIATATSEVVMQVIRMRVMLMAVAIMVAIEREAEVDVAAEEGRSRRSTRGSSVRSSDGSRSSCIHRSSLYC